MPPRLMLPRTSLLSWQSTVPIKPALPASPLTHSHVFADSTYSYLAVGKHKDKPVSRKPPCRSQRARVALTEERQRTSELLLENRRLAAEAATAGQDSWDVVSFLRGELLGREAEVTRLVVALSQVHSLQTKHSSDRIVFVLSHWPLPEETDVTGQRTANMRCPHAQWSDRGQDWSCRAVAVAQPAPVSPYTDTSEGTTLQLAAAADAACFLRTKVSAARLGSFTWLLSCCFA